MLVIETSTDQADLALFSKGELVEREQFGAGRRHSALVFAALEGMLPPKLERIVVGLGPGSYAGVRIALAAATGLSLATGVELVGLPSLLAMGEGDYLAVGDARRETYFVALVRGTTGMEPGMPVLVPAGEVREFLAKPEWAGLPIVATEPLALVPEAVVRHPSAEQLGRLILAGRPGVPPPLEPLYLREAMITLPKELPYVPPAR